jgi:DNA-binding HxlR family transcriptional regulator
LQKATGFKTKPEKYFMEDSRSSCPVNLAVEVFGDKWTLLILRDIMFEGKRHFRELLQSQEKIASNILSDRLTMLEKEGLITKKPDPDHKQKFIYNLTLKGIDLLPILKEIGAWSIKHRPVDLKKYAHANHLSKCNPEELNQIKRTLVKDHIK